jgi:hypothetical protein
MVARISRSCSRQYVLSVTVWQSKYEQVRSIDKARFVPVA